MEELRVIYYRNASDEELENLKNYLSSKEVPLAWVIIKKGKDDKITSLLRLIKDNPYITEVIAKSITDISNEYHEVVKLTDYCFARKINIIIPFEEMSLYDKKGELSAKFKAHILMDTNFEHF